MKYAILIILVLISLLGIQSWRLGGAQEDLGSAKIALASTTAVIEAQTQLTQSLNAVKAEVTKNRQARRAADAMYNQKVMKELRDVKAHECFRNSNVIPAQHIRVLMEPHDARDSPER